MQAINRMATHLQMATVNVAKVHNPATLRMALQVPLKFQQLLPKHSTFPVIWDSGASISMLPDCCDFVRPLTKPAFMMHLKGIAKGLHIEAKGHVMWAIQDTLGMLRLLKVPAFLVPKCPHHLLSTSSLLQ